jgi:FtsP/CotA-like multicopper oxidase with cupredoxin domain
MTASMRWLASSLLIGAIGCGTSADDHSAAHLPRSADGGAEARAQRPLAAIWGAPLLADENPDPAIVEVRLKAGRARAVLDGKETDVLAYNGTVPGPLLQARPGQRVKVHFENGLDEATTVHWHGLRIPDEMDGSPRVRAPVPPGGTFTYDFVVPEAGSFWYHPHVETHAQLEQGLYGPIVVQDDLDPIYDVERFLVLDDVLLDPATGAIVPPRIDGFSGMTGRYGNVLLTNGKHATLAHADAKKGQVERWRLVNVANARKMLVHIEGASVRLIATDGGLLTKPQVVAGDLVLPVGGRLDLEVSYDRAGETKLVIADAEPKTMFAVAVADGPEAPRAIPWPDVTPPIPERAPTLAFDMTFDFVQGASSEWTINGEAHAMDPLFTVARGTTMKIRLSNASGGIAHPFHLHGQFFRVLDDPSWPGLRDTVMVPEHGPIEIVAYLDNPGRWMAHCHILEHAEVGMMAEIEVRGSGTIAPATSHGH